MNISQGVNGIVIFLLTHISDFGFPPPFVIEITIQHLATVSAFAGQDNATYDNTVNRPLHVLPILKIRPNDCGAPKLRWIVRPAPMSPSLVAGHRPQFF